MESSNKNVSKISHSTAAGSSNLNDESKDSDRRLLELEESSLIFQISYAQNNEYESSKIDKSNVKKPENHISLSDTPHQWTFDNLIYVKHRFSSIGRLAYIIKDDNLIIVDMFLNTQIVLKDLQKSVNYDKLGTLDFVVLNAKTLLVLYFTRYGNNLQRLHLHIDEGRYDRKLIYQWRNGYTSSVVCTDEATKKKFILKGSCSFGDIIIGRLKQNQFVLDSIVQVPVWVSLPLQLTDNGKTLRAAFCFDYQQIYVYDLGNNKWYKEEVDRINRKPMSNLREYYWTMNFLYSWDRFSLSEYIVFHRMDLKTEKWTELLIKKPINHIIELSTIKNSNDEDEGLLIVTAYRRGEFSCNPHESYFVKRLMFKPQSLETLCWFKVQQTFTNYNGKNVFEFLRNKRPLKNMFPPIYESMKSIEILPL